MNLLWFLSLQWRQGFKSLLGLVEGWGLADRRSLMFFSFFPLFFCNEGVFLALWRDFWICEERFCVGGCGVSWTPSNWIHFANTRQLGSRICYGFMVLGLVEGRVCLQVEGKSLALWHNFWICEEQICAVGGCGFSWTSSNWIQFASARELGSRLPHGNEVISWTRLQSLTMVREQVLLHLLLVLMDSLWCDWCITIERDYVLHPKFLRLNHTF